MRVLADTFAGGQAERKIEAVLKCRERPTAVIALWESAAGLVIRVARRMGIRMGRDLEVVAWKARERNVDSLTSEALDGYRPAVVVWRMRQMAKLAIARLDLRRTAPDIPVSVTKIPVRLELAKDQGQEG